MTQPSSETSAHTPRPADVRKFHRIRFRRDGQEFTIQTCVADCRKGEVLMVKTDHGLEPGVISGYAPDTSDSSLPRHVSYFAPRRATREEEEKYARLPLLETEAFTVCQERIRELSLSMRLVQVERFYNGSKVIFYFTAENRVDFRELVKLLVQEFRTRVEMRQVGVRHETQMLGGIGPCGRELCCSSFLKQFDSVSIKMAKTQDLPLNPAKISGLCNRLLCCLGYEYEVYRDLKKHMPRVGKLLKLGETTYQVVRLMPLQGAVLAIANGEEVVLREEQWSSAKAVPNPGKPPRPETSGQKP